MSGDEAATTDLSAAVVACSGWFVAAAAVSVGFRCGVRMCAHDRMVCKEVFWGYCLF